MSPASSLPLRNALGLRLAQSAPRLLRRPDGLLDADIVAFWTESRRQLDRWDFIISAALEAAEAGEPLKASAIDEAIGNAASAICAEPILRAWIATLCEFAARRDRTWRPVALRAFEMLLAARLSALKLMTHPTALPTARSSELDRLRRRSERRTDWLLAALAPEVDTASFGFSRDRIRDFSLDAVRIGRDHATASLALRPLAGSVSRVASDPLDLLATIEAPLIRFERSSASAAIVASGS